MSNQLLLAFTQHALPFLGAVIGTYMLFRMAFVDWKLRVSPWTIFVGMIVETISIGVGVYTTITNPDTTNAILGWTGVSIAIGLLGPTVVARLEQAMERSKPVAAADLSLADTESEDMAGSVD